MRSWLRGSKTIGRIDHPLQPLRFLSRFAIVSELGGLISRLNHESSEWWSNLPEPNAIAASEAKLHKIQTLIAFS